MENLDKTPPLKYQGVDGLEARATYRVPRAASLLNKFLNLALQRAADAQLSRLRISKVELAPDFSQAWVWFFSAEQNQEKIMQQQKKLERAIPFLRRYLAKNILMRRIPSLQFKADCNGIEIEDYRHYVQMTGG